MARYWKLARVYENYYSKIVLKMQKSVLVIGSGEIGKKHILSLRSISKKLRIVKINSRDLKDYFKTKEKKYFELIILCSPSSEHLQHFKIIEKNISKTKVLIEKPLFNRFYKISKNLKNYYYVGYNLRHHPILKFLKDYIKQKKIFSIYILCTSYLPFWRKKINYQKSVSAQKKFGGGVLLELSHEIDYVNWIFGEFKNLNIFSKKISDLKIDVDDILNVTAKINNSFLNVSLNFFSMSERRKILIDGANFSIDADIIKNKLTIIEKNKKRKINFNNFKAINTYKDQIKCLLNGDNKNLCKELLSNQGDRFE